MNVNDFDYDLPEHLIAQTPLTNRSSSKMLVMDRLSGEVTHHTFSDIVDLLGDESVLVLNDTKVIPSRLTGVKDETGAVIELLLLNEIENETWKALAKPAKRVKVGTVINFGDKLFARCIATGEEGIREFKLEYSGILYEILDELGTMPLPPYISEKLVDQTRYQTVYAKCPGSAAAPTAGLHFTKDVLAQLKAKNIEIYYITLHVGLGTFRPVMVDDINDHIMHSEYYEISEDVAKSLNAAKSLGKNIVSVGTTTTRVLESVMQKHGKVLATTDHTDIFIYPGYKFLFVDSLITNFHLPKSTLIMLVSAFSKREYVINAYNEAIKNEYRFFSFGDSMFIR